MKTARIESNIEEGAEVTCTSCRACCCKLEVMLMGEDDVPLSLVETDRWGGQVMKRLGDGWCAALDRATMLCRIYEQRPAICRDYQLGGTDCLSERSQLGVVMVQRK
jgi:Fe-S-cluster containining protein